MIEELNIFGVFVPAALVWAVIAGIVTFFLRNILQRLPLDRILWQPGLLDLSLFVLLWWGLSSLADRFYFH